MSLLGQRNKAEFSKYIFSVVAKTPLHPQWLLGMQRPVELVRQLRGHVLDVGCASRWAEGHLPKDAYYHACDYPSTGTVMYAAEPDFFANASAIPVRSASMDAVICLEVMEHVREPDLAIRELARVTRPGGTLLLSVPFIYPIHDIPHDYRRYTKYGLICLLESAGYHRIDIAPRGHAICVAGAMLSMAIVGGLYFKHRMAAFLLLPLLCIAVAMINLSSRLLAYILPNWEAMTAGYVVRAEK